MKKFIVLLLVSITLSIVSNAQYSPFKPVKVASRYGGMYGAVSKKDSTFGAFRFVTSLAAYTVPDRLIMTGAGFGWQLLDYNYATQRVTSQFSISGFMWATGTTAPSNPATAASFGVMAGVLNDIIMAGWAYNPGTKRGQLVISIGVNLNN